MNHLKSGNRNAKSGNVFTAETQRPRRGSLASLSPISYLLAPARAAALALTLALTGAAQAQVTLPHSDFINYTAGTFLVSTNQTATGWTNVNTGDSINIASGNLSYSGLPSSTGNKIAFDGTGMDAAKVFTPQTSGSVYWSFLLNVTSLGSLNTTGGYFATFTEGSTSNFGASIWTRADGTGYDIGINPRTTAANTQWTTGTTSLNNTLLVVVSYTIVSGTGNDIVKMWINPQLGGLEPTPTLTATNTGGTDLANLNRILIRQDSTSATPFIEMDEFRVSASWADVAPASSGPSISTTGTLNPFTATAGTASAAQTFSVTGANLTADITVTAPTNFQVASDGATYGGTATITQSGGSANGTVSVRVAASASAGAISGNVTLASTGATGVNVAWLS